MKEIHMEDVNRLLVRMVTKAEDWFTDKGRPLTNSQSDEIWNAIEGVVTRLANYPDYRNYN